MLGASPSQIIGGMIKYWPLTNSRKEELFLSELEQILNAIEPNYFARVHEMTFKKLSECIANVHFQVSSLLWSENSPYPNAGE